MSARAEQPPDLILHIGSGKTGTTTVQGFLHRNREALLRRASVLFPRSPGRRRHMRVGLSLKTDEVMATSAGFHRMGVQSPGDLRSLMRRELAEEVRRSAPSRLLLSDEALFGAPSTEIARMAELAGEIAGEVRLVAYLRRQDDHLISRYQQLVKVGETRRLTERTRQDDLAATYDYALRLRSWHDHLQPTHTSVRVFQRDRFVDGSLLADFLHAADIELPVDSLLGVDNRNESLDAESVEFLRLLNVHLVEQQGVPRHRVSHQRLVRTLAQHSTGPVLTLPPTDLERFMTRWESGNEWVARELLGREAGDLFSAPRRMHGTTTDQRLDPSRLPHYLEVAEVPSESHAALRALAEREARHDRDRPDPPTGGSDRFRG